ncbi:MAG: peptide-methionine (R)-S-oxide reductase MsrB [Janthinobacterium lividum]
MGMFSRSKSAAPPSAFPVSHDEAGWQQRLSPEQFRVLRRHGTERAGTSPLDREHRPGRFLCAGCDAALFASAAKFDSGTGWPSFTAPLDQSVVGLQEDRGLLLSRTEVHCARCGGHLGHVFPDGPRPTGLRYCMNGAALRFVPAN